MSAEKGGGGGGGEGAVRGIPKKQKERKSTMKPIKLLGARQGNRNHRK